MPPRPGHGPKNKWKPGQSGNPKGRPKVGLTLAEQIRAALAQRGPNRQTHLTAIIQKSIEQARAGDHDARKWLADRGWGMAVQSLDVEGATLRIVLEEGKE